MGDKDNTKGRTDAEETAKAHEVEAEENLRDETTRSDEADEKIQNDIESLVEELKAGLNDEKERRLRLMADFDNYKKRIENEKATFGAIANLGLIQELLEVYDDLQLALSDQALDLDRAKTSMTSAQDKLNAAAARAGIERVDIKVGDEFNRETMEAVSTVPDEKNKGRVIAVISSAFKFAGQDRIIKAAKVIVGK